LAAVQRAASRRPATAAGPVPGRFANRRAGGNETGVTRVGGGHEDRGDREGIIAAAAPSARHVRAFNTLGWENFAGPPPGASLFFAADPEARTVAEELIGSVGLEPVFVGDATATPTVDSLFPLWFALVKQNDGNRKLALRLLR
jgi:predicted dinucleotide-binding enzyme